MRSFVASATSFAATARSFAATATSFAATARLAVVAALVGVASAGPSGAHGAHGEGSGASADPPASFGSPALFEPPAPGSYELPPIDRVSEHGLLDDRGAPTRLPGLAPGQVALVGFVYASCGQGCPLSLATFQQIDRDLAGRAGLRGKVRLVTVSFDPERDTPLRMHELRESLKPRTEWRFVTAPDVARLLPVLDDYGQRVTRRLDVDGTDSGLLEHVLKVFLVDDRLRIRNVYSTGLMDARLVLNDIQTVLAE